MKKWGNKFTDYNLGTIPEIVADYLAQFDEPKHIKEITEYVLKFRKTNLHNIRTNICYNTKGVFRIFKNGYYGLSSKKYHKKYQKFMQRYLSIYTKMKCFLGIINKDLLQNPLPEIAELSENILKKGYYINKQGCYIRNLPYENLLKKVAKHYKYSEELIKLLIKEKIESGELILTRKNRLEIHPTHLPSNNFSSDSAKNTYIKYYLKKMIL